MAGFAFSTGRAPMVTHMAHEQLAGKNDAWGKALGRGEGGGGFPMNQVHPTNAACSVGMA